MKVIISKTQQLKLLVCVILIIGFSGVFAQGSILSLKLKEFNQLYKENLMHLSVGESRDATFEKMGGVQSYKISLGITCLNNYSVTNPTKNELKSKGELGIEIVHFITGLKKNSCSTVAEEVTPILFIEDRLIGSGKKFLEEFFQEDSLVDQKSEDEEP